MNIIETLNEKYGYDIVIEDNNILLLGEKLSNDEIHYIFDSSVEFLRNLKFDIEYLENNNIFDKLIVQEKKIRDINTIQKFDKKWGKHLEKGFYGMEINDPDVILYVDSMFELLNIIDNEFKYSQIKLKFGYSRVYLEKIEHNEISKIIENGINNILFYKKINN